MLDRRRLLAGFGALAAPAQAQDGGVEGEWSALLRIGSTSLRLRLDIAGDRATLYSLDQGNAAIPGAATVSGDSVRLAFPSINARFEGVRAGDRIEGTFTQGAAAPLVFHRGGADRVAPPARPDALTAAALEAARARVNAPALAAASRRRDGRALDLAAGRRARTNPAAVTTADRWHLGSISKSMTATLIAGAVEAGLLGWEDEVGDVLGVPGAPCAKARLTHLLSHRAGLQANLATARLFTAYRRYNDRPLEERRAFALEALALPAAGPMEETFVYSNVGYVIAAAMLEARAGAPWEELIRTRLFAPLGMDSAGFGPPGSAGAFDEPMGHTLLGAAQPPGGQYADNVAAMGPAGRVHASLDDLLAFAAAHRDRTALLRGESWDRLHTPPYGGQYAMGLVRRGESLWHNGSNTLWYAEMIIDPGRGIVAAAASNKAGTEIETAVGETLIGAAAAVA